ncbi:MAG: hypothetical protein JWO15_3419 [Sphingomonadales bacterium]|nr:hypothetical protein [Sphingomonadales bacterium]
MSVGQRGVRLCFIFDVVPSAGGVVAVASFGALDVAVVSVGVEVVDADESVAGLPLTDVPDVPFAPVVPIVDGLEPLVP